MSKYFFILFIILFNGFLYCEHYFEYNINKDKIFIYAESGNYKEIKKLLESGEDVNRLDNNKISPLMLASFNGHKDIVELLIKNNADVNIVNDYNYSAIMAAASRGHLDIFNMLLENGANIYQVNSDGNNILIEACIAGNEEIIKKVSISLFYLYIQSYILLFWHK